MALKDWEKVGRSSWSHKGKNREGIQVGNWDDKQSYFEFWNRGRTEKRKLFKTKKQAMRFAVSYMRKH